MYINQAIKKAETQKRGITRKVWFPRPMILIPTNTNAGFLMTSIGQDPSQKWMPYSDDLTAKDWIPYG